MHTKSSQKQLGITILGIFFLLLVMPSGYFAFAVLYEAAFGGDFIESIGYLFYLLSPFMVSTAAAGLLKRKEWGRFCGVLTSWSVILILVLGILRDFLYDPYDVFHMPSQSHS